MVATSSRAPQSEQKPGVARGLGVDGTPKEVDRHGPSFFVLLDERVFLEAALISLTAFLMAFLEGIMMVEGMKSFRKYYERKDGMRSFR